MGYTTFGTLLGWLEEPCGLTVRDNRAALVSKANDIRQHFYDLYEKVRLFLDAEECFCVQEFSPHCDRTCDKPFAGITLPEHVQQVEAMKVSGVPVTLFNKWREWKQGFVARVGCNVSAFDLGDGFCTERDIGPCPQRVKIMALTQADCGKAVRLTYWDVNGKKVVEEIKLATSYAGSQTEVARFERPGGVVFPTAIAGGVVIAMDDPQSTLLSEYYPGASVISLRRHRLAGACAGEIIQLRGSRRYTPMYYDWDVVETDNKQAFVEMALSFKFSRSQSVDPQILQKGVFHQNQAKNYLLGEQARDEGGGVVRQLKLLGTHKSRSRLPTRRRRC